MVDLSNERLRNHFLGWQCRIRQIAMRQDGGRPSPGMRPRLMLCDGREIADGVTMLIVPRAPEESTAYFRHQVRRTNDPREIYEKGLSYLQSTFFQDPRAFSDQLMAVFYPGSAIADTLFEAGECMLEFSQFSQRYRMFCEMKQLEPGTPAHDATLWHNRLFNPELSDDVHVVAFIPDWSSAQAAPAP